VREGGKEKEKREIEGERERKRNRARERERERERESLSLSTTSNPRASCASTAIAQRHIMCGDSHIAHLFHHGLGALKPTDFAFSFSDRRDLRGHSRGDVRAPTHQRRLALF
jgi:hypothetical protein